jgi:hypothetical protein
MVRQLIQIILIFLVACSSAQEPPKQPEQTTPVITETPIVNTPEAIEPVVKNVVQTGTQNANYGFTRDNKLRTIEKDGQKWEYVYQKGRLTEIKGPRSIEFFYDQGKLHQIKSDGTSLIFNYDQAERLSSITGGRETIYFSYDTLQNLRTVNRGVAGETSFNYDKNNNVKEIERAKRITTLYYDDRNRVRQFDGGETQLILGYFKDDKLISLTGNVQGKGMSVSYGPAHPPIEAKLIHGTDTYTLTTSDTNALYQVVDDMIYCKQLRRLPDILFEGVSYAFYDNYYNGTVTDYFFKQYTCAPYETQTTI